MNALFLIFFFLAHHTQAACLPEYAFIQINDEVQIKQSEEAIEAFENAMKSSLPKGLKMIIRADALNPRVNADVTKSGQEVVIQIMGGMLRHKVMTPEVLQLLLCHELGHVLGGEPFKSRNGWSSTEGQADYYSSLSCSHYLAFSESEFLEAALKLTTIYAQVVGEPVPDLTQCEEQVSQRMNYGYPSVQCRLDTLMAGWNGLERPRCWFNDNSF